MAQSFIGANFRKLSPYGSSVLFFLYALSYASQNNWRDSVIALGIGVGFCLIIFEETHPVVQHKRIWRGVAVILLAIAAYVVFKDIFS